jgi:hypothetical protein
MEAKELTAETIEYKRLMWYEHLQRMGKVGGNNIYIYIYNWVCRKEERKVDEREDVRMMSRIHGTYGTSRRLV